MVFAFHVVKNGHQKDIYYDEIWVCVLHIFLGSIMNTIRRAYSIFQKSKRIFTKVFWGICISIMFLNLQQQSKSFLIAKWCDMSWNNPNPNSNGQTCMCTLNRHGLTGTTCYNTPIHYHKRHYVIKKNVITLGDGLFIEDLNDVCGSPWN